MKNTVKTFEKNIDWFGNIMVKTFHLLGLFAIGGVIVWSAVMTFIGLLGKSHASIEDILLLFIFLELGAMVGINFKTSRIPVRFLIYIAVTALTRLLIGLINVDHKPDMGIVLIAGAIFILAMAEFILRYGSASYPLRTGLDEMSDYSGSRKETSK